MKRVAKLARPAGNRMIDQDIAAMNDDAAENFRVDLENSLDRKSVV